MIHPLSTWCGYASASFFKGVFDLKDGQRNPYLKASKAELSLDRAALDAVTLNRLQSVIRHAYYNCGHYRMLFDEWKLKPADLKSLDDIRRFPQLTREDLKVGLENLTTRSDGKWIKSSTGGTTSSPVSYYRDRTATLRRLADTAAIDAFYGRKLGDRVAYLWGAQQDFPERETLGRRLRNLLYLKTVMLPSSPLDQAVMEEYLMRLDKWRPTFLQSYPTPLYEFCRYLDTAKRKLPYLKSASVTAEPLYDHQREVIENVLGFKLFNWYGSRELGRIAFECDCHDGLHINEPTVFVEIEPDPSLPGGCGHLVVTDLWNKATPFIRYRTGDIACVIERPCSCGLALRRIGAVEGRLVDTLLLPGGRKVPGVSLTNRIINDCAEVAELQVVQKGLESFLLRYVRGPAFSTASLTALSTNLRRAIELDSKVEFEEVREIPKGPSGKVRFVISELCRDGAISSQGGAVHEAL